MLCSATASLAIGVGQRAAVNEGAVSKWYADDAVDGRAEIADGWVDVNVHEEGQ